MSTELTIFERAAYERGKAFGLASSWGNTLDDLYKPMYVPEGSIKAWVPPTMFTISPLPRIAELPQA